MIASIIRALAVVVPIGIGAWIYALLSFPAEYLVQISFLLLGVTVASATGIVWLNERNRIYFRGIADWAEDVAAGNQLNLKLPDTEQEGYRIAQSLLRVTKKHKRQSKKRSRELGRLLTILDYMNDGVVILNKSGRVRIVNPAACDLFDTTPKEARGRTFIQFARDHRIAELWQKAEESGLQVKQTVEFGDTLIRVVATPFLYGNARGFLVILQDLTELSHLQTVRQNFVTNVSHELRTPLASLRALAETLSVGALEDPPAARRFLARMEIEVEALTDLVEELFDLSRIESGQLGLELEMVAPSTLVEDSVERLTSQADLMGVELAIDVPGQLPPVTIDRGRMEQVMVNLLHNAIKFTPKDGQIAVNVTRVNGHITIAVQDTGVGIPETDLPHIFERFYKVDRSRHGGGSGLGLAIAKHIVQAHDGKIWADSVEGQGSTFSFSLPIA